jgi:hypothetical protein
MFNPMRSLLFAAPVALLAVSFVSCAPIEKEKKPVGPQSSASNMPWNTPVSGQGQGQFAMMPQLNQRR